MMSRKRFADYSRILVRLMMEYVQEEKLEVRLAKNPLPLKKANPHWCTRAVRPCRKTYF